MREIGDKFLEYSLLLPDQVIGLSDELKQIESQIETKFNQDLKAIRKVINDKKISIKINFKNFTNPHYLYKTSLYAKVPQSLNEIIQFYLANLHICKEVLISIVRYIHYTLLKRIEIYHYKFIKRENNVLIEVFHEFIGCCKNIEKAVSEYMVFYRQIETKLGSISQGVTQLTLPFRHDIRIDVKQSLTNTRNGQYVALPSVRSALEFSILQDIGIKITNQLKINCSYREYKEIVFTDKMKNYEVFDIMKKMGLCTDDEIDVIRRIYRWGSRSVHHAQIIPVSLIWYCLFFLEEPLRNMLTLESCLHFQEVEHLYAKLLKEEKIRVIRSWETFFPSYYNRS